MQVHREYVEGLPSNSRCSFACGEAGMGWLGRASCALSSAVEHYLHTIKMAILASFSHLFHAFICIASYYRSMRYDNARSKPMYAHKIPNFEIGLQVGCKFSVAVAVIGPSVKTKTKLFMPQ
jgi:hypothetical protein